MYNSKNFYILLYSKNKVEVGRTQLFFALFLTLIIIVLKYILKIQIIYIFFIIIKLNIFLQKYRN